MKLKTKLGISLISISSVMLYVGCSSSDSSTSAPEDLVANTLADLPNCTESREGKTAVLLEDKSTYLCTEGKWTFVSAAIDEVESLDDLLNCTNKIEGDSVQVKEESAIYVCSDGEWEKWRVLTDTLSTADDLLACVSKREGNTAFVTEENALYECVDGGWEKIVTYMKTVSSQEKLFNCTSKNEGDSSYVSNENTVYLCISESWRELGELGTVSDSLPNCTEKREGERVFLSEEHVTLICNANKWKRFDIFSAIEEEENSEPESSSSENEWEDYEPVSSSSLKVSSSSTKVSSSSVKDSSSSESEESGTFTDTRDGQTYKYVKIGNQVWMAENLNYEIVFSYCYKDSIENCKKYGRLYNWETALNVCPSGWHLPTNEEFETLISNVGGEEVAGKMLKSTTGWIEKDGKSGNGIDKYGFNAIPAGDLLTHYSTPSFANAGQSAYFWSATEHSEKNHDYIFSLNYGRENAYVSIFEYMSDYYLYESVRCLRD